MFFSITRRISNMLRILLIIVTTLLTTACSGPRYVDYFPYHDDGTPKPRVALMPIIDSTHSCLDWSLSDEIFEGIRYEFMNSGNFYLMSPREVGPAWNKAIESDYTGSDLSFAAGFKNSDFVIILELIDRSVTPCMTTQLANRTLTTSVRIKVVDIRCDCPRIVLYEVFKSSYMTTPSHGDIDGNGVCWGTPAYGKTCCGLAHQRLVRSLSQRLEEVIWRAK